MTPVSRGILYALTGFTVFSLSDSVFKYIGSSGYPVLVLVFWSAFSGVAMATAISLLWGGLRKNLGSTNLKMQGLRALFLALNFGLFICGLILLPMAKAYALIFATPLLTAVLSVFFLKEKIGWSRLASIVLGFAGVLVILRPGSIPLDTGTVCVLLAAVAMALGNIISRRIGEGEPLLAFSFYRDALMLTASGAGLLIQGGQWPSGLHIGFLAASGILSATGIILVSRGFTLAPSSAAAPTHYVQMIWAPLIGWLVFRELPDVWTAVGAVLIVVSGLYLIWRESCRQGR
ncbi:MAG: DMT family transporter [Pseudomonadota bacterium]|nr:DMT family transporter [Pseudomonadota bacterium]